MTLMSRKVDYALLIMSYLDQKREGACAREIADRYSLSKGFVANILKQLCQEGYVASHRGKNGGYVILRPVEETSLAELMESLDDSFHLAECTRMTPGDPCAHSSVCPVKGAIADVHHRIREMLRGVTLAEIIRTRGETGSAVLGLELVGTR
jgi:Rrf2 family transcriptional regulator, cysteine metabolism repressor